MNDRLTLASLLLAGVVLGGCVSGARLGTARWSQFHADGPSQGWMAVPSTAAVPLVPKWSVDVGLAGYSSPVIGPEGTVYITTAAGEVVAVNPDGTIKWRRALPEP